MYTEFLPLPSGFLYTMCSSTEAIADGTPACPPSPFMEPLKRNQTSLLPPWKPEAAPRVTHTVSKMSNSRVTSGLQCPTASPSPSLCGLCVLFSLTSVFTCQLTILMEHILKTPGLTWRLVGSHYDLKSETVYIRTLPLSAKRARVKSQKNSRKAQPVTEERDSHEK